MKSRLRCSCFGTTQFVCLRHFFLLSFLWPFLVFLTFSYLSCGCFGTELNNSLPHPICFLHLFILYHIISYHTISYHIISYHIISYHIISYHIISYPIISNHIISNHMISILNVQAKCLFFSHIVW